MSVSIGSSGQWNTLLSGTEVVVADFYADWCGPCKMIGPHFEKLAEEHSRPKKIAFAKINTDNQNDLSRQYGVSSMPTFKVFHKGACIETIKGANPAALAAAVTKAKQLCSAGGGGGAAFESKGRKLGGESRTALNINFSPLSFFNAVVTFLGLYVMSFFSLNAYQAAQKSIFNPEEQRHFKAKKSFESGARVTKPPPRASGFKTLADIGSS